MEESERTPMLQRFAALLAFSVAVSATLLAPAHAQQEPQTNLPRTKLSIGLYTLSLIHI